MEVDFVILSMGRFSDLPNIPEFPANKGPEAFEGKVIHSMEYASLDYDSARHLIKGKRVTVVGSLKFALDIAMESSLANGVDIPSTVICRTPHWHIPDYFPWGFPLALLYFNRFSELLVHKPGEGLFFSLLASLLLPLRWGSSKFVESYIKTKNQLKKLNMIPKHSFFQDLNTSILAIVPDGFYDNVEKGSIVLKRSESFGFCKDGVVLGDGRDDIIKSDLVILATGFKGDVKLKNIFESPKFQDHIMGSTDQSVPLYRQVIHPRIPQLAVIGFSESIANLYTSEIRCRWLAELLDGKFELPSIQEMEKDVLEWDKFMKRYSIGKHYRRSSIAGIHIWYNDQLCKDMGWNHKRKTGFWAELFEPYGPMDYAPL